MRDATAMTIRAPVEPRAETDLAAAGRFRISGLALDVPEGRLIHAIDLDLAPDTLTVVMGPNGSGKSLLLRLMHGLITPTAGTIAWGGVPLGPALRRRQALVFQRPVLLRRSVAANIEFVLEGTRAQRRERCIEVLERAGLVHKARQAARLLSGGEQQRLAMARALALEPAMLLLDEPSASLDPASVLAIEQIVLAAQRSGTKIVFVTHDPGQARRLAQDVVFLDNGRLAEHTPADRFFSRPHTRAAQAFLEGRLLV